MSNSKFFAGVILGAAAGVALAMFAQSEKGQQVIADIKSAADKAGENLKNKYNDLKDQVTKTGKQFVKDVSDESKNYTA